MSTPLPMMQAIIECSSRTVTLTYYARSDCLDVGVQPCVAALNQLAHPGPNFVNTTGRTVDTRGYASTQAVGECVEGKQAPTNPKRPPVAGPVTDLRWCGDPQW